MFCCKKTYRLIWLFIPIRILVKQFYFMVSVKLSDLVSVEEVDVFGRLSGYLGVKDYSRVYSINFTDGGGVYVTLSNGGFRKDLGSFGGDSGISEGISGGSGVPRCFDDGSELGGSGIGSGTGVVSVWRVWVALGVIVGFACFCGWRVVGFVL